MSDLISRQAAIDIVRFECGKWEGLAKTIEHEINALPSVQPKPEVRPISYADCANAMLKMWMVDVLTDSEYYRIMDKLNAWKTREEGEQDG